MKDLFSRPGCMVTRVSVWEADQFQLTAVYFRDQEKQIRIELCEAMKLISRKKTAFRIDIAERSCTVHVHCIVLTALGVRLIEACAVDSTTELQRWENEHVSVVPETEIEAVLMRARLRHRTAESISLLAY